MKRVICAFTLATMPAVLAAQAPALRRQRSLDAGSPTGTTRRSPIRRSLLTARRSSTRASGSTS